MFLDRLICRIWGHAPWERDPGLCSRCGEEIPGLLTKEQKRMASEVFSAAAEYEECLRSAVTVAQRGPTLPWWGAGPPPGWREPTAPGLESTRRAEYDGGWNRIFEGRERETK